MGLVWVQEKVNIREQSDDQDYKNLELNGGYLVIKDQNAKNFNMRGQFGHYYPKLWTNLDKNFRSWGYFRENSDIFWGYFGQLLLSVCGSNYQQGHFWKADIYWGCWDRELLLLFKGRDEQQHGGTGWNRDRTGVNYGTRPRRMLAGRYRVSFFGGFCELEPVDSVPRNRRPKNRIEPSRDLNEDYQIIVIF
ncbi:hypothetical protein LXL04_019180 [Taraxacum kok-saghyz]